MLRYPAIASIALFLTACANIEHRTPEARQQIKHDLKLTEVTDTALTSFCWLQIGGPAFCKNTPGISVLTPDSLLLVSYENRLTKFPRNNSTFLPEKPRAVL